MSTSAHVRRAVRQGLGGVYPSRYHNGWKQRLHPRLAELAPGAAEIIDVGAGATPTIAVDARRPDWRYVGLDISAAELDAAGPEDYDEQVASAAAHPPSALTERFDVALSWLVLEHVENSRAALAGMRQMLRPGGTLLAFLATGTSLSGVLNRAVPHAWAEAVNARLLDRPEESVFPAHYDRCTPNGILAALGDEWSSVDVDPVHCGASYWRFARPLFAGYLAWEEWCLRTARDERATYLFIDATR